MRALVACCLITLAVPAAAVLAQSSFKPKTAVVSDETGDARGGKLDLQRVTLGRSKDGRLRSAVTTAQSWTPADLISKSGPPGSVCLRLWTLSDPPDSPPDYLVCVTAQKGGQKLRGSVLRERNNQLPERVAAAAVSRANGRTIIVRFSQSAIARPARIDFSAEATRAGCARVSCIDTAPEAPRTSRFQLRKPASTGT